MLRGTSSSGERDTAEESAVLFVHAIRKVRQSLASAKKDLRLQDQIAVRRHQENLRRQGRKAEGMLKKQLHLQEQEAGRRIQEALQIQEQEAECWIQEALQMQEQEAKRWIQMTLQMQEQKMECWVRKVLRWYVRKNNRDLTTYLLLIERRLQEKDSAIRALQRRLEQRVQEVDRLRRKQEESTPPDEDRIMMPCCTPSRIEISSAGERAVRVEDTFWQMGQMLARLQQGLLRLEQEAQHSYQEAFNLQEREAKQRLTENLVLQTQMMMRCHLKALSLQRQQAQLRRQEAHDLQETAKHRFQEALREHGQEANCQDQAFLRLQEQKNLLHNDLRLQEKEVTRRVHEALLELTQRAKSVRNESKGRVILLEKDATIRALQRLLEERVREADRLVRLPDQTTLPGTALNASRDNSPQATDTTLRILFWNAGGLTQEKFLYFKESVLHWKVDLYFITEVGAATRNPRNFELEDYILYTLEKKRIHSSGIFTGLKVKTSKYEMLHKMENGDLLEAVLVETEKNQQQFRIVSVYNAPKNVPSYEIIEKTIQPNSILVGDFNSHSPRWGYPNRNDSGKCLEEMIDNNELEVIDSEPTFVSRVRSVSRPDLVLTHRHIARNTTVVVLDGNRELHHRQLLVMTPAHPVHT